MKQPSATRSAATALSFFAPRLCDLGACAKKSDHAGFASAEDAVTALIEAGRKGDSRDCGTLRAGLRVDRVVRRRGSRSRRARSSSRSTTRSTRSSPKAMTTSCCRSATTPGRCPCRSSAGTAKWYLDGAEGADEIVYRRIGRNELGAIAVCRGYVDAQYEYAAADHDGEGAGIFAHKLVSDPGTQNGLYWEDGRRAKRRARSDRSSQRPPAEGYRAGGGTYHGYRYRPLFRQTDNANGGALDYFDKGVLRNGFALVAWPADYGASGVMTFIVNHDGVVFQKDLGEGTDSAVAAIDAYDPDSTWVAVVDSD